MKKHATPYLLTLLFTLALLACEKATLTIEQAPGLTLEQRFEKLDKPLVLYQFSSIDLQSGEENGWIIDHQGFLKAYHRTRPTGYLPASHHEALTRSDLNHLHALASESAGHLAVEELYPRFQLSQRLQPGFLSSQRVHQQENRVNAFYAYTNQQEGALYNSQDWCKNEAKDAPTVDLEDQVTRIVLNLSGRLDRYGNSKAAVELYKWMDGLNKTVVLSD